jgi:hypothetical protein
MQPEFWAAKKTAASSARILRPERIFRKNFFLICLPEAGHVAYYIAGQKETDKTWLSAKQQYIGRLVASQAKQHPNHGKEAYFPRYHRDIVS